MKELILNAARNGSTGYLQQSVQRQILRMIEANRRLVIRFIGKDMPTFLLACACDQRLTVEPGCHVCPCGQPYEFRFWKT